MKKYIWMFIACGGLLATSSCSKMDDFRAKYQGNEEIPYPGILDSTRVISGNKRILLHGLFSSDPNIVKYQVFWNGKQNMIEKTIARSPGVDTVKLMIDNLTEGGINFEIRTFDKKGNISVPINVSGVVYGDNYSSAIVNRVFNPASTKYDVPSKILTIDWQSIDVTAIFTELEYTTTMGSKQTIKVTNIESTLTKINDYAPGTDIFYRTAYLPQKNPTLDKSNFYVKNAIDTFYVAKKDSFKR